MIHEFRLSPLGKGGVSCDEGGAFVGAVPMLVLTRRYGRDEWRPRNCDDLSKEMSGQFGLPVDMSSKMGGLRAIANALNDGDMARAQVATLLLRVPNPPSLSKGALSRQEMIKLAGELHWGGLLKADWDPDQHPRWPAGAPDSQGGQFAPKGDDEISALPISQESRTDTRIQLADAGVSDASDDPMAQAAARAAEEAQRNANAEASPASREHESVWQRLGSELSDRTKTLFAGIGRAQIKQSNADLATAIAEADAFAHAVRAYEEYRAQPWLSSNGQPLQVPVISVGDVFTNHAEELSKPNPLHLHPVTNADWIDRLVNFASLASMAVVGPELKAVGSAAEVADGVAVSANAAAEVAYEAEVSANAAERAFATTEGVAVSGLRAIDRGGSYEIGVRNLYGDLPLSERKFKVIMDGKEVTGIADNTASVDGKLTAVEAKYVDDWVTSLRNPASEMGDKPWAVNEQEQMVQQARKYSQYFPGGIVYHTNSVDLAIYYTKVFRKSGVTNFRFVITPAIKMSKNMAKNYMERIFGVGAFDRKVPGTGAGEEASVRYLSFDDPASIPKLFDDALDQIKPKFVNNGGAILEGTKLELPDGGRFFAILFSVDLEGWRKQLELGAKELGLATAKVLGDDVIVSDGRSYPLSSCKIEFQ